LDGEISGLQARVDGVALQNVTQVLSDAHQTLQNMPNQEMMILPYGASSDQLAKITEISFKGGALGGHTKRQQSIPSCALTSWTSLLDR
jgi:hypothetical protein